MSKKEDSRRDLDKKFEGKLAVFTDCYDHISGVSRTYRNLAQFCEKTQRRLDIFTHGSESGIEDRGSVRIFRFKPRIPLYYYSDLAFDLTVLFPEMFRICQRNRYDLIQTATPGSIGLNALWIAKRLKIPMVGCFHTALPEYIDERRKNLFKKVRLPEGLMSESVVKSAWWLLDNYYRHCRLVLVPTQAVGRAVVKHIPAPVRLFQRGVDSDRFHPAFRKAEPQTTALYVGRVAPEKNLQLLVELFRDRKDIRLKIVGDGPFRKRLEESIQNIVFTGFLRGQALSEAYASADFFVFPSKTDTFGNVVLEAMSSGLPVVVTDQMGPKELVTPGKTGFIADSTQSFQDYIDQLARNQDLRLAMSQNAREAAKKLTWNSVFNHLFQDYQRVWAAANQTAPGQGQLESEFTHSWGTT